MARNPGQDDDRDGDDILVELLARGRKHADCAREAGVSIRTLQRRLEQKEFRDRITAYRQQLSSETCGRLASYSRKATEILFKLATNAKSEVVRMKSSIALVELHRRLDDHFTLTEQIRELQEWRKGLER